MAKIEFYTIYSWMRDELNLSGTELDCYAVIYCLSQGDNEYIAGIKNLMQLLHKSEPTIIVSLKSLTEKGLVEKKPVVVNNATRYYYKAIKPSLKPAKEILGGTLNNLSGGTLNNLTRINNIKEENKKENNKKESIDSKKEKTRFIKPTLEQIKEFIEEKKLLYIDAEEYYNYFESVGWVVGKNRPMKSWKASCMTWNNKHKPKASYYDPLPEDDETVLRFKKWMRDNHGQIGFVEKPLTCDGYIRLQKQYGRDEVINQLVYIDANIGRFKYSDIEASIRLYFEREQ